MNRWLWIFMAIATGCAQCNSLKILAFMIIPWRSHQFVFHQLIRGLGNKGHQVDFYSPLLLTDPPKTVNQIKVEDTLQEALGTISLSEFAAADAFTQVGFNYKAISFMVRKVIEQGKECQELLRSNSSYDIVMTESMLYAESLSYVAHKFKALNVVVAPQLDHPWVNEMAGLPNNPSYMLTYIARHDSRMNFLQRLNNAISTPLINLACYMEAITSQQNLANDHIRYEGWESRPPILQMISDAALILVNSHPSMAQALPRAPHVKEIGGIHITPPRRLPKGVQEFMDGAQDGVIYFSLGTNLDPEKLLSDGGFDVLMAVFRNLKQKILWKVDPGLLTINDSKILAQKWFPQQDVLGHKNIALFITHGGLQSMVEAINCGVPTLTMPYVFDQFKDAEFMVSVGMGLKLSFENLTESSLSWSINELLTNPKYRQEAKKRQSMFRDRPMKPLDEAVYWIEYVGRHGKVLQPAAIHMPFYQLYLLDVMAALLLASVIVVYITKKLLTLVIRTIGNVEGLKRKMS